MPKAKGGKGKKKRKVLQVSIAKSANKSPSKDKGGKTKEQTVPTTSEAAPDQIPLETRSRRTPKPRKIIDVVPSTPKARSSKSTTPSKGAAKRDKRSTSKKKGSNNRGGKGGRGPAATRGQVTRGKRKQPAKKTAKPSKQPRLEVNSDSGEDERRIGTVRGQGRTKLSSRGAKRLQVEEEELQEELVPLPPESEEEEEEVDEEEDEVDDSLFFGLPPEKSLEEPDGLREPETYSCSHCREKFKKEDLPEHLSQCPDRYVQCRECGKVLSNLQTLERHHKRFHLKIREVPCTLCDKMFIDEAAARKHLKTVHFKVKNFHCPHCDKAFSQRNKLTYHVRTHSGEKPYSCTECGRSFSLLWNLKTHMRTHTGEKPYACDICGRQFTQKQNMTSHMTTHRKPKPDRRTFPGLSGSDLNGSSTSYGYEGNARTTSSAVKSQAASSKSYSLSNVLKSNYISSKPVLQGIGQHYLLDDVASVVDIPGRSETQVKVTSQTGLGAAAAQINQNLLNQQMMGQHGHHQVSVETGLGLLSAVARKGDDSNVQVDGIVSLDQSQSGTGNPSLDQVVEVFLQSNVSEGSGDNFIPSMVGAETMVSTSEIEHEATGVVETGEHQGLLSGDQVSGDKGSDVDGSPNKQMVGQITAQTVIPVDQANLAGLANILQNPEILAAINAASSSNKFIVIGPVGMFSGQQTNTTNSNTVSDSSMGESLHTAFQGGTTSSTNELATVEETNKGMPDAGPESVSTVNDEPLPRDPVSARNGEAQLLESEETHLMASASGEADHEYGQSEAVQANQEAGMRDSSFVPASSSENVIQISSSFSKAIAGMSSRITTNNISDVTAALMSEIHGQIQSQSTKGAKTDGPGSAPDTGVAAVNNEITMITSPSDAAVDSRPMPPFDSSVSNTIVTESVVEGKSLISEVSSDPNAVIGENEEHVQIQVSIHENPVSDDVSESSGLTYAPGGSSDELGYQTALSSTNTTGLVPGGNEPSDQLAPGVDTRGLNTALSQESIGANAGDNGTLYLSQLPSIATEQVAAERIVTDGLMVSAESSDATVVVNPSIVQSLLNNINLPAKSVDDNGDFPVIDIATGNYIGTSNMLNSVPVSSDGLEVTIGSEQLACSTAVCASEEIRMESHETMVSAQVAAGEVSEQAMPGLPNVIEPPEEG